MLFSIQGYIQDSFNKRGFQDDDGYAVKIANFYFHNRKKCSDDEIVNKIHRLRTNFFLINDITNRKDFESKLISKLDKLFLVSLAAVPKTILKSIEEVPPKEKKFRLTICILLERFAKSVERKGVEAFWISRKKGELRKKPEKIASNDLCIFVESE